MPVVEVATWTASKSYLENPAEVLKPVSEFFKKTGGWESFHYGVTEEDGTTFFLLLGWESLDAHKALIAAPGYPQSTGLMAAMDLTEPLSMNHIEFNRDYLSALTAPVTEIVLLTLNEGKTKEDLNRVFDSLAAKVDEVNSKYEPCAWGQSLEAPDKFYLIIGWDSVQAHEDAVKDESFHPVLTELQATANLKILHTKLQKLQM
ncbi:hypothetical protein CPC08DRAFT_747796 [Agrocybe pediades]|nr:hypothetical protein CPC08DRAFT_747796 [Agrocybe pediades]